MNKVWYIAGSSATSILINYLTNMVVNFQSEEKMTGKYRTVLSEVKHYLFSKGNKLSLLDNDELLNLFKTEDFKKYVSLVDYNHIETIMKKLPGHFLNVTTWFKPGDTDIFFINSPDHYRFQAFNVDFVYTKIDTVQNLLLNFDLPCCRTAYNHEEIFYVSAHCLKAILTGSYYLPAFISNLKEFTAIMKEHKSAEHDFFNEKFVYDRIHLRMNTYLKRGFKCQFVETDIVPNWIITRFHYAAWKTSQQKS
jgi:hypothetical protein